MKKLLFAMSVLTVQPLFAKEYLVSSGNRMMAVPMNFTVKQNLSSLGMAVADLNEEQVTRLKAHGYKVQDNKVVTLSYQMSAAAPSSWALEAMRVPEAHQLENGKGEGITVCVVDSGVDANHPVFAGKKIEGESVLGGDGRDFSDKLGHGTAMAGLIAGESSDYSGVAPHASLYAVKALEDTGTGTDASIAQGILACIGKSQVINLSLGSTSQLPATEAAVLKALEQKIIVIGAAGNQSFVAFPARVPGVIAVGAVDSSLQIAPFSAKGPALGVVAPGVDIRVAWSEGTYMNLSGTSMSAALVSGVAAIQKSRNREFLQAKNLGLPLTEQGRGLVDALATAE